jgi:GTPase involved in cell partitioning and DNA repair
VSRSGRGGNGEVSEKGQGRVVDNFKYRPGGNLSKRITIPFAEPDSGADGGSVVLYVEPAVDTLLHLRQQPIFAANNGANGNPAVGSRGALTARRFQKQEPPLRIPVPPGTVVKRKKDGLLLGELINVGTHTAGRA